MMLGVGVIGMGFMGRTHAAAWAAAHAAGYPCRLVALCDANPERIAAGFAADGNLETSRAGLATESLRRYADPAALFADPDVQIVSVCTPTDTHVDLACRALAAGKHVLVEKPVSLSRAGLQPLLRAAREARTLCLPAMCMRFWPGWPWLRDRIRDGTLGPVRSLACQRLGSMPAWSHFYHDTTRSGGALFDLHIHDVDFVYWCFGMPDEVSAHGSNQHVLAAYHFARGPALVSAEGAWDQVPAAPFAMRFVCNFERATARFALGDPEPLVVHGDGRSDAVALDSLSGYEAQVRHFVDLIRGVEAVPRVSLADVDAVTHLVECEARSLRERCVVAT